MFDKIQAATITIAAGELHAALKKVKHAQSREDTHYCLNGAYLHVAGGKLQLTATDGYRLASITIESAADFSATPGVIIPTQAIADMLESGIAKRSKAFSRVMLRVEAGRVILLGFDGTPLVECEPIDGTFPDYNRAIPTQQDQTVALSRVDFRKAIEALTGSQEANGNTPVIKLTFEGDALELNTANDTGTASCVVTSIEGCKTPLTIGFNGRHLADIVDALESPTLEFHLSDAESPTRITGLGAPDAHAVYVLMPMRI